MNPSTEPSFAYTDQQRMPGCAYYPSAPSGFSPLHSPSAYFKDACLPEVVEYADLGDHYYASQGGGGGEGCIKHEPLEVHGGHHHPHAFIGYPDVEKFKLERKRERNRIAATKCRLRKLERISQLEEEVRKLKAEKEELGQLSEQLRGEVHRLKTQIKQHIDHGCTLEPAAFPGPDSTC